MPPWHSRLHLGSPSSKRSSTARSSGQANPLLDQQVDRAPSSDPRLHEVPVLPAQTSRSPRLWDAPHHSRSHSPPLLLPSNPKKHSEEDRDLDFNDGLLEGLGDPTSRPIGLSTKDIISSPARSSLKQNGERDLVTGNCVTCDSSVRWPRYLDVFRCTVCLMVNDLKPTTGPPGEARYGNAHGGTTSRYTPSNQSIPSKGKSCFLYFWGINPFSTQSLISVWTRLGALSVNASTFF